MSSSSADDTDWIKGLVAEALMRASDDEPPIGATEPAQRPATAPAAPSNVTTPASQPAPTPTTPTPPQPAPASSPTPVAQAPMPAVAATPPPVVTPPPVSAAPSGAPSPQRVAPNSPLVVGRQGADTPNVATPSERFGPQDAPLGAQALGSQRPGALLQTETSTASLLQEAQGNTLTDDSLSADPIMVEADATTEGFRSSDIRTVLEWLAVIVSALLVALLIKAFVLQAFWIPSESMETTVNKGDRILVNKVSYRLHEVRRGDLVVFKKLPGTPGDTDDLIKRAIALPGETIEVRADGRLYIWGAGETAEDALLLEEPYLDPQNAFLAGPSANDALSVDIWDERCVNQPRTPGRCTLGDDQLFMMGDNRNSSSDSRFFGPITEDLIVGRAFLRIWPLGEISSL